MPKLEKYKKKRNLKITPEPLGRVKKSKSKLPIFVIQRHDARQLHFDLRLEHEGVLKSWAVPKGPSVNPKEKRLAVHVEDHPMDYAKFEGQIPTGEYGAGNVEIWDHGTYNYPKITNRKEITEKINYGFGKGHIKVKFNGSKMKGEYSLIRLKDGKNWLLVKDIDKYADVPYRAEVNKAKVENNKNSDRIERILAEYKLKRFTKKLPIKPMLATLTDNGFDNRNWIFEIKHDGYRVISEVKKNSAALFSRNGQNYSKRFSKISEQLQLFKFDAIFDGEIVIVDKNGVSNFGYFKDFNKDDSKTLIYYVFDILGLNGFDLTGLSLVERKAILQKILPKANNILYSDHIEKDGKQFFNSTKELNLEGIIAKEKNSTYEIGIRTKNWLKIKNSRTQDCIIVGYLLNLSGDLKSLALGVSNGKGMQYVGNVGSGFNSDQSENLFQKLQKLEIKLPKVENFNDSYPGTIWVKPKLVCEIEYLEITPQKMLRHPIFVGLRDKDPKDVNLETPDEKPKRILEGKNSKENLLMIDKKEVKITNLDKIYWPKDKYTKEDLINYYIKIADTILPYLKDRPLSLNRHPNGIYGESFYQKDIRHEPEWIKTVDIYSEGSNRSVHYAVCNDRATLIYLANLGSIEIHPWHSQVEDLDKPTWGIIDLDPHGVGFKEVIKVANVTHDILDKLGLPSYIKTSGLFGMHIYIPIVPKYTYEQVRDFILLICQLIHNKVPNITSLERKPEKRKNKLYLDFLQNRRGATIAAPYSVRPIDGARVSAPLKWSEINTKLDTSKLNIKTMSTRLKKVGDLWKGMNKNAIRIEDFLEKIEKFE